VLGCDEVDVVATARLQLEHHPREVPGPDVLAFAELARLEVLAEDAAQVAPREEDRARASPAAQDILLPEVGEVRRDARVASRFADGEAPGERAQQRRASIASSIFARSRPSSWVRT
jgi:hypothetical protein